MATDECKCVAIKLYLKSRWWARFCTTPAQGVHNQQGIWGHGMIPGGCGCWADRADMYSSLSSAGRTAVDHAILQSTDGIQKGKSQRVYHNHTLTVSLVIKPISAVLLPPLSNDQARKEEIPRGHTQKGPSRSVSCPEDQGESGRAEAQSRQPQRDRHETLQFRKLNCLGGTGAGSEELPPQGDLEDGWALNQEAQVTWAGGNNAEQRRGRDPSVV